MGGKAAPPRAAAAVGAWRQGWLRVQGERRSMMEAVGPGEKGTRGGEPSQHEGVGCGASWAAKAAHPSVAAYALRLVVEG